MCDVTQAGDMPANTPPPGAPWVIERSDNKARQDPWPIFRVPCREAALGMLRRIARHPIDECRACAYTRFLPPFALLVDDTTGCAWLWSVTVDARLGVLEAEAQWEVAR